MSSLKKKKKKKKKKKRLPQQHLSPIEIPYLSQLLKEKKNIYHQ